MALSVTERKGMIMELRQLRVFVAVAEELHFGRAAEREHLSQPSISGHIRQLEAELGVRLLDRNARKVSLTEAGSSFLEDVRPLVKQADAAASRVRSRNAGGGHRLRIGYAADASPRKLPIALRRLANVREPPSIQLSTGEPRGLMAQLRDRNLDAAIVALPVPPSELRVTVFDREDAAVAVRSGTFDGREADIPLELVADGILLTRSRRLNPGLHDSALAAFRIAGVASPLLELEGVSVEQLLLQVAAGAGMALVPRSTGDRARVPGVVLRGLARAEPIGFDVAVLTAADDRRPLVGMLVEALMRPDAGASRPELAAA
jgi:DNA-binding transcriptional LysR family regulator